MIRFIDGPAVGHPLLLARAPLYLRVVIDAVEGTVDALDQLTDEASPCEVILAYRRRGKAGSCHVCFSTPRGRRGAWYATGDYEMVPDQPPDEVMRDNESWRQWATAQAAQPKECEQ